MLDNAQIRITGTGGKDQHFHAITATTGIKNAVVMTAIKIPAVKLGHYREMKVDSDLT
jgi:hypothetical protein